MATVEERLRALERFRYRALAQINACQTMTMSLWVAYLGNLVKPEDDPVAFLERQRAAWLKAAEHPQRAFPGADPASLDLISQEYRDALDALSAELLRHLRSGAGPAVARKGRPRRSGPRLPE
jgi:hypothetical protein